MRTAIASFPRSPGERRIEIDLEHRRVVIAFYLPQLARPPRVEHATNIAEAELDAHIDALVRARDELRATRAAGPRGAA